MENNKLPQHLHEILVGYLLGDGGIFYASKKSGTPRFEFSMGQERLEFAQHLALLFKDYASNGLKEVKVKAIANGSFYTSYRFKTKSLELFNYYRDIAVKVVPQNIAELLTPVALAYLIMADGNYDRGRNRVRIYTNSFSKEEVTLLATTIQLNFGIYAGVLADRRGGPLREKDQYILTIGAKELPKLKRLVSQHMLPSMKYRIG
ncbi:LAGLIDADG DNA endonuclease [Cystobasidium minutum MCA 4210]|uniref:LAGLIDADG DNA endonuclease n=1 Tax=Cystobasidium minutum MCA 4210 TaxID=1397322 RepID=UPI0034CF6F58|eukprot:jgi/Rhomi1/164354/estExt_Genewise1Plus.C_210002